jgi:hypothetical protein
LLKLAILSPFQLELSHTSNDPFDSIFTRIHELYHKAVYFRQTDSDRTEFLEFVKLKSVDLCQEIETFVKLEPLTVDTPREIVSIPVTNHNAIIDLDWNSPLELNTSEYFLCNDDNEKLPKIPELPDPTLPNEFTQELVQMLRRKNKRRI